jgi:toxin ParE1/3/4
MARFKLTPLSRSDLQEIHDFIAADNPQAATHYLRILKEKCQQLANVPGLGVPREEYCGLYKFPVGHYLIFYRPSAEGIEVIRILHGARDLQRILQSPTAR